MGKGGELGDGGEDRLRGGNTRVVVGESGNVNGLEYAKVQGVL